MNQDSNKFLCNDNNQNNQMRGTSLETLRQLEEFQNQRNKESSKVDRNLDRDIYYVQEQRKDPIGLKRRTGFKFVAEHDNTSNYERTVLKGGQCDNTLNQLFFSQKNIDIIQNQLRYTVWEKSNKKFVIDKQSETELIIIMRALFLQNAKNLPYDITKQIEDLNQLTVNEILPKALSNIQQYIGYLENKARIPDPLPRSLNVNSAGTKSLRSITTTF